MILHGGDLDGVKSLYGIPKDDIIDFSSNVNPLGASDKIKKIIIDNIDIITKYPDKNYSALRESISHYCSCDIDDIVVGNGATEIISLFIRNLAPKTATIISPSYSEYENELNNINCSINFFGLNTNINFSLDIDNLIKHTKDCDLVVLCNPNNPTGNALDTISIKKILDNCKFLMIDETYVEFTHKSISAIPLTKNYNNLFIIRGTSKFFAVPGIRLGYGISKNKEILSAINTKKEPWSVNSIANLIGTHMFIDTDYIERTKLLISREYKYLLRELSTLKNLKLYNSHTNFILCKILNNKINATTLFNKLIKKNILIRDNTGFPFLDDSFFRFCILSNEENNLLITNLKNILKDEV